MDNNQPEQFEVGKYYRHNGGEMIHIIGELPTTLYGVALMAETTSGADIKPVGRGKGGFTANWTESTHDEWMKNFSETE